MEAPIKTRYDKAGPQVAEALRRRHFEAHYVSTAQEALDLALTLIPVLAALILKPKEERDTWLVRAVKRIYVPLLARALLRKGVVVTLAVLALVGSLALFPFLGKEFMP